MRLWRISPKYLDPPGLVALWREALLAKKVLEEKTKGYTKHPQLDPFKETEDSVAYINTYLLGIWEEAERRGYNFDKSKIGLRKTDENLFITHKEAEAELEHLRGKLEKRNPEYCERLESPPELHPLFCYKVS
jgi:hypothetical protein